MASKGGVALALIAACAVAWPAAAKPREWPVAGGWTVSDKGPEEGGCSARLPGEEVDTVLLFDRQGGLMLAAAHPDWQVAIGEQQFELQIGDGERMPVKGLAMWNFVMIPLGGDEKERQLRAAHQLRWYFPVGMRTASISHAGEAIDSLRGCLAAQTPAARKPANK